MNKQSISSIHIHNPELPKVDALYVGKPDSVYIVRIGPITLFFENPDELDAWTRRLAAEAYAAEAKAKGDQA